MLNNDSTSECKARETQEMREKMQFHCLNRDKKSKFLSVDSDRDERNKRGILYFRFIYIYFGASSIFGYLFLCFDGDVSVCLHVTIFLLLDDDDAVDRPFAISCDDWMIFPRFSNGAHITIDLEQLRHTAHQLQSKTITEQHHLLLQPLEISARFCACMERKSNWNTKTKQKTNHLELENRTYGSSYTRPPHVVLNSIICALCSLAYLKFVHRCGALPPLCHHPVGGISVFAIFALFTLKRIISQIC